MCVCLYIYVSEYMYMEICIYTYVCISISGLSEGPYLRSPCIRSKSFGLAEMLTVVHMRQGLVSVAKSAQGYDMSVVVARNGHHASYEQSTWCKDDGTLLRMDVAVAGMRSCTISWWSLCRDCRV